MSDSQKTDEPAFSESSAKAALAVIGGPPEDKRLVSGRVRRIIRNFLLSIPLVGLVVWTLAPFLVTISVSFKNRAEVFADPSLIPGSPSLEAYREVLSSASFTSSFVNSVVVGAGTTLLTLALGVPAAYAFARFDFRGRHLLLLLTLLPRLVPSLGLMVPIWRLAIAAGALDNRMTLIVVYTGTLLPLAVWLMVGFFQQIPRDIEEAAAVDGATLWRRLRHIVAPLAAPAMITIGVLAFREAWNEFTLVLVLTSSPGKRTLPFELYLMQGIEGIANFPGEAAFTILTVLPFILIYTRVEKYVVAGLISGSGK
ncbi:MAG TPA: carbohydrate ABC transporter permease [Acidimicrobiia bacterium]|nr:carbohydrate ABC transporter permease [Acidimicrobiia bacterium]